MAYSRDLGLFDAPDAYRILVQKKHGMVSAAYGLQDGDLHSWSMAGRVLAGRVKAGGRYVNEEFRGTDGSGDDLEPLLVSLLFTLDFLIIHPFEKGNVRMALLLLQRLLLYAGYDICQYVSLEKQIDRPLFYRALTASCGGTRGGASGDWLEDKHKYWHFIKYMLGVIEAAYREFDDRIKATTNTLARVETVTSQRQAVTHTTGYDIVKAAVDTKFESQRRENQLPEFTKKDITAMASGVSEKTVERELKKLVEEEYLDKLGNRKGARYVPGVKKILGDIERKKAMKELKRMRGELEDGIG